MACTRARVLAAGLALSLRAPARAQALVVPLTGERVRDIRTAGLFHTLMRDFFLEDDATTYVQTGDIPAMWLRDSSAQTIPYIRFQTAFPVLRARFAGVIERNARNILIDPYANAYDAQYRVWERKWEIDSLAWPIVLASVYWRSTHDRSVFSHDCTSRSNLSSQPTNANGTIGLPPLQISEGTRLYKRRVQRDDRLNLGRVSALGRPGRYRFNIPQNAIAVVALRDIEQLAVLGYGDTSSFEKHGERSGRRVRNLASTGAFLIPAAEFGCTRTKPTATGDTISWTTRISRTLPRCHISIGARPSMRRIWQLARLRSAWTTRFISPGDTRRGWEVRTHRRTTSGRSASSGARSPLHFAGGRDAITTLAETDGESGMIHESFYPDGYWRFTRPEFGWANALGAELFFAPCRLAGDAV